MRTYIDLLIIGLILEAFPLHTSHIHHVCRLQGLPQVLHFLLHYVEFSFLSYVLTGLTEGWTDGRLF